MEELSDWHGEQSKPLLLTLIARQDVSGRREPTTYTDTQVVDLNLRVAAMTLMCVNIAVYFIAFKNRSSLVSRLILVFLLAQISGVIVQAIPKFQQTKNDVLTIYIGIFLLLLASETFNWVLYVRFNLVAPFNRKLRLITLTWLCIETLCITGNYLLWCYGVASGKGEYRVLSAKIYSGLSVIQAASALVMSGYFVSIYYFPKLLRLRSTSTTKIVFSRFFTGGLLYLALECVLHLGYTVLFYITPEHQTSANSVTTAVRYAIFLVFIFQIRNATAESSLGDDESGTADVTMNFFRTAAVKDDGFSDGPIFHGHYTPPKLPQKTFSSVMYAYRSDFSPDDGAQEVSIGYVPSKQAEVQYADVHTVRQHSAEIDDSSSQSSSSPRQSMYAGSIMSPPPEGGVEWPGKYVLGKRYSSSVDTI
ncbi:uncharacterized protein SPPG_04420 [Spizellomyces punctatus DAOM BR117]|uniref:Uncharacterized protein n=1 Tax=Spizellomyces punctatus (strain DAOM BR117) TaxID=645134 RepID=A0A0L0HG88_SPIPD|nr:uncharacterized protein SPPG_04420 [Spizellomyces punctatus DAOM BR117]KND00078.1 hypothetical protein SPPG_04420 [Spizellomyces punctatus DAOM BR117]|eukprot:XP_016608117.1 hypothetical protein SPPG_04420 [Spizellomyces punctatus DAOM BR117]